MWASVVFIVACSVVSGTLATERTFDIGEKTSFTVMTWPNTNYTCHLETPTDIINFGPQDEWDKSKYVLVSDALRGCAVTVTFSEGDSGVWRVFFTVDNQTINETVYTIKVNPQSDNIMPDTDTFVIREIEELPQVNIIDTHRGDVHNITISEYPFVKTESCHIKSNDGKEYQMPDIPDHAGVEWIRGSNIACGIKITVEEEIIGNWTLYSRDVRFSTHIERRLPITIYVEETVAALSEQVVIAEGRDLYVSLKDSTGDLQDTCELQAPDGIGEVLYERDELHHNTCGYIIKNVSLAYTGVWYIKYGKGIRYSAPIRVFIQEPSFETVNTHLEWPRDTIVDMNIGPEDATYCKAVDPIGRVVFEKFYRCYIYLVRPEEHHEGVWVLTVGMPGKILTEEYKVKVTLTAPVPRPVVITSIEQHEPHVLLSCALPSHDQSIRNCKFKNPSGKMLLALPGIGEDRYSFHGANVILESNVSTSSCGIRITQPTNDDLGIWRCAIENQFYQVHYGFLAMDSLSNSTASVNTEPKLTPTKTTVSGPEGSTIMSCKIRSKIRYCYFRAENGSVFNINYGVITDTLEYAGSGFEAGDCSVRFKHLQAKDSGEWSCHVGLSTPELPEQRASFAVNVYQPYSIQRFEDGMGRFVLMLNFHDPTALEYCRFVRSDGLGFTLDNIPSAYQGIKHLDQGSCGLTVVSQWDRLPWTVVARVKGHSNEIWGTTTELRMKPTKTGFWGSGWDVVLMIMLLCILMGLLTMLMTRDDYKRWKAVKNLRNSFRTKKRTLNFTNSNNNNNVSYI